LGTLSKRIVILLHAVHDCPCGRTAAIARHVSFSQITCHSTQRRQRKAVAFNFYAFSDA